MNTSIKIAAVALSFCSAFASAGTAQDLANGKDLFVTFCVACHGYDAQGDGWKSEQLEEKPNDLQKLRAENGGVFPVVRTAHRIDGREEVKAHGGPMPFYGDIMGRPTVMIETADGASLEVGRAIADLLAYLQSIQTE